MACKKTDPSTGFKHVFKNLSLLDKLLPIFIIVSIVLGIVISVYAPGSREAFDGAKILNVSIPLAIGLIVMIVPPLCKIEWENLYQLIQTKYFKNIVISLALNWIICPFIMFGLAWLTLFDEKEYRQGIIMIGLARCIAMVFMWNEISHGDASLCTIIVLINSLLQIVLYAPYQIFFCYVITGDYDEKINAGITYSVVAKSVAFFLGIPLGVGLLMRAVGLIVLGKDVYEKKVLPVVGPFSMIGLLYTIIVIFIEKGDSFIHEIGDSIRCFVPLVIYFPLCFFGTLFLLRWLAKFGIPNPVEKPAVATTNSNTTTSSADESSKLLCGCEEKISQNPTKWKFGCNANYKDTITQSFTAASNNFELSIAVAISIYGNGSRQAIASIYGPLLEIPILLILCFVAKYFQVKFIWNDYDDSDSDSTSYTNNVELDETEVNSKEQAIV